MKNTIMRNWIVAIVVIAVVAALVVLSGLFRTSSVAPQAQQTLSPERMQALIPRGRELALAGDCFGCHSMPQGPMGAGGLAIATPFGTLYSTNITPDKQYGIGNYTRADFHRVMRDGIAPGERNLYPAMPFVFSHITTPDDIDALYAYNMSIPAMPIANKSNTGVFVLPVRPSMDFWTLLNFPDRKVLRNDQRSAEWNRGGGTLFVRKHAVIKPIDGAAQRRRHGRHIQTELAAVPQRNDDLNRQPCAFGRHQLLRLRHRRGQQHGTEREGCHPADESLHHDCILLFR